MAYPNAASAILEGALKKFGLQEKVDEYRFVAQWEEIVGETIAKKTKPYKLFRGCLFVSVENSAWAQELSFRKQVILDRLARLSTDGKMGISDKNLPRIRDLRFVVAA
jgi:predicted nucleic acid-binding Zn ribbon protein